uniref:Uncharacterized protein n=2 Tax=Thermorudis TaxID=1649508 RepID=A0A831WZR4_9BACT
MWLIVPLVFLLSWKTCHRFGQAVNETAAWIIGYLLTAGLIWVTDVGGVDIISANPVGPGAAVAYSGGFAGMIVSRYRWKRRGGHLQPADDRLSRALRAMRTKPATPARPANSPPSPSPSAARASSRPRTQPAAQARPAAEQSIGRALGTAVRMASTRQGGKPNRWVRALNAMLDGDSNRNRR